MQVSWAAVVERLISEDSADKVKFLRILDEISARDEDGKPQS